jgi:hypothetical protein
MKSRANYLLSALVILALLLSGVRTVSVSHAQTDSIIIDGVKEAAWGDPLAADPIGDMTEPNLDLQGLYLVEDANNYYIGFDATASTWGIRGAGQWAPSRLTCRSTRFTSITRIGTRYRMAN